MSLGNNPTTSSTSIYRRGKKYQVKSVPFILCARHPKAGGLCHKHKTCTVLVVAMRMCVFSL